MIKLSIIVIILRLPFAYLVVHTQVATEKDFRDAVDKVIKSYAKFSSTPKYMTYN